jgi:hypothetical protein
MSDYYEEEIVSIRDRAVKRLNNNSMTFNARNELVELSADCGQALMHLKRGYLTGKQALNTVSGRL